MFYAKYQVCSLCGVSAIEYFLWIRVAINQITEHLGIRAFMITEEQKERKRLADLQSERLEKEKDQLDGVDDNITTIATAKVHTAEALNEQKDENNDTTHPKVKSNSVVPTNRKLVDYV